MKKVLVNKEVKSLLVKAINSENRLLELSHNIIAIMNGSNKEELEVIRATITTIQKSKSAKGSTLPAKLKTICNKLIKGSTLPKDYEKMTIEGIKSSFVAEPKKVSAKAKKVAKGTASAPEVEDEEIVVPDGTTKTADKDDLISEVITLFSKAKFISANKFDTLVAGYSVDELNTIDKALKLLIK